MKAPELKVGMVLKLQSIDEHGNINTAQKPVKRGIMQLDNAHIRFGRCTAYKANFDKDGNITSITSTRRRGKNYIIIGIVVNVETGETIDV